MEIKIEKNPSQEKLEELGVFSWSIWEKEISEFPWEYTDQETCYFIGGEATIVAEDGRETVIEKGDLVTFPKGMKCVWKITQPVKKHYKFGE